MNRSNHKQGIKEIAKRANVSIATVDRVIHDRKGVSKKTKQKILEIMNEVDYQPNILARRLASKKRFRLAVLIPKVSSETNYWKLPLKGIERAENEIGHFGIEITRYFYDLRVKSSFLEMANQLFKTRVDGVILAPSFTDESIEVHKICDDLNIPCVLINSDLSDLDNVSYFGPDLFESGCLAAHLMKYIVKSNDQILILNIATETDRQHLLTKEEGFKFYFKREKLKNEILRAEVNQVENSSVEQALSNIIRMDSDIDAIFVTNARVTQVASYLEKMNLTDIPLIGYDFLEENVPFLNNGIIDFLICQQPDVQAYKGIISLYNKLILNTSSERVNFMPLDIITKENYSFYQNQNTIERSSGF